MFTRSTSNTPNWKNQSFNTRRLELYEGLVPDLDIGKENNGFFMKFFACLGGGFSLEISQWDSELLIFTKSLSSLKLVYHRPRGAEAVGDTLLHFC